MSIFANSDWATAIATVLGFLGAAFAFFVNRHREQNATAMQTKRRSYEDYFSETEAYSAGLRVQAYNADFHTSEYFIRYESVKAKLAFYASRPVIEACANYDKALKAYRSAFLDVHRHVARQSGSSGGKDVAGKLADERSDRWKALRNARKKAIHTAACEVGAIKAERLDPDLVDSLFGGRSE